MTPVLLALSSLLPLPAPASLLGSAYAPTLVVAAQTGAIPPVTPGMLSVFAVTVVALAFFFWERVPVDVTAIGVMVVLMVLEPWTQIGPTEGISGLSSPATVTVLAMFVLSEGIRRTGLVRLIGERIVRLTGSSLRRQLAALVGISGTSAGVVNNTPVVAVMIPMVMDIARKTGTSASKLLIPVSYAAMMGGMLTLIGTSTSILASDVSARLIGHPFSMFEFTHLGAVVLLTGAAYLLLIGWRLLPDRVHPEEDLTEEFEVAGYLTEVIVTENSPMVGATVREALEETDLDVDVVQILRDGEAFVEPLARKEFRPGDILVIRTDRSSLMELLQREGLHLLPEVRIRDEDLETESAGRGLVEVVVLPETSLVGETLTSLNFRQRYEGTVLAIRRGGEFIHKRMDHVPLRGGDTLLVQASARAIQRLAGAAEFVVTQEIDRSEIRTSKTWVAVGILAAVVGLAALEIIPIVVSALAGVVAMVATGCLKPSELYGAISWNVIFLLAGVIPLGMALERTGGADLLAHLLLNASAHLSPALVLGIFYLLTSMVTQLVSNNASVVLMLPIAVDAAQIMGAEPFSFVLAVTFAASTALLTPLGYQTNLMVYGPGGYKFSDFFRAGIGLQLLLAVVTTAGIILFWGV